MDGLELVLTRDPEAFAGSAGEFLAGRPERNVAATILERILSGQYAEPGPLFAYAIDEDGELRLAVLRTPPWPLLVSDLDPVHAPELVDRWLSVDPELPGASGLPQASRAVAAAWQTRVGGQTRCRMQTLLHSLEQVVDPPRPAQGSLRPPRPEERDLIIEWNRAFEREAHVVVSDESGAMVDARLRSGGWLVWDDHGPVSLVGFNPPVAGAVRIGPVYTPPERRNHGYASSAVAAASRRALAGGATSCILFTDVTNPTSNKIYADVGYRAIAEWEEHSFEAGPPAPAAPGPGSPSVD
jgi:predicted GNAT family acetyltransferase